jgi:hypothetical protein
MLLVGKFKDAEVILITYGSGAVKDSVIIYEGFLRD